MKSISVRLATPPTGSHGGISPLDGYHFFDALTIWMPLINITCHVIILNAWSGCQHSTEILFLIHHSHLSWSAPLTQENFPSSFCIFLPLSPCYHHRTTGWTSLSSPTTTAGTCNRLMMCVNCDIPVPHLTAQHTQIFYSSSFRLNG